MAIAQNSQPRQNIVIRIEDGQLTTDFNQLIEAADWLASWGIFIENSNSFLMMSPFPSIFYKKLDYLEITVLDRMVPYFEGLFNRQQFYLSDGF